MVQNTADDTIKSHLWRQACCPSVGSVSRGTGFAYLHRHTETRSVIPVLRIFFIGVNTTLISTRASKIDSEIKRFFGYLFLWQYIGWYLLYIARLLDISSRSPKPIMSLSLSARVLLFQLSIFLQSACTAKHSCMHRSRIRRKARHRSTLLDSDRSKGS